MTDKRLAKVIELDIFDPFSKQLEDHMNERGMTLCYEAERLHEIFKAIRVIKDNGLATKQQVHAMNRRFIKQLRESLFEIE